jgi:WD40 repeat protein
MRHIGIVSGLGLWLGLLQAAPSSPYFGQPVPGMTPAVFAPGIVSTDAVELNTVFTPDLKEMFFARAIDGVASIFHSRLVDGAWSTPRELLLFPGGARALAVDMAVSPDGSELYFLGNYQPPDSTGAPNPDIWRSRRVNGTWATADKVPAPISTDASEVYPVIVADGSMYFLSNRPGGMGRISLYRAQRLADGSFAAPVLLPAPINHEAGIGDTFVSPDEKLMVFGSSRPPGIGAGDLFVSFRRPDGSWGEPTHLGSTVNTEISDFCPFVTPDGKYFFFSRRQTTAGTATAGDVYWMDATFLEQFRRPS